MKKLLLSIFTVALSAITVFAQAPEKMNYQGVARDLSGNVLANQAVGLQVKIHSTTSGGAVVYQETHSASTNAFGLFNVVIGGGTVQSGTFSAITWGSNAFFAEVLMDATGGTSYTSMGTQQLVSVPYALNAKTAASTFAVSGTTNYVSKFTSASTLGNSGIFDNGTSVGIGTVAPDPSYKLHVTGSVGVAIFEAAADPLIKISEGITPKAFLQDYNDEFWISTYSAQPLHLGTNNIQRLTVDGYGYVGIGTTNPQWNLQVNSTGVEAVLQLSAASSTGSFDLDGLLLGVSGSGARLTNMENSSLAFGTNAYQRMVIAADGNVGIGTTAPAYQLHVEKSSTVTSPAIYSNCTHTGNYDVVGVKGQNTVSGWYGYGVQGFGGWYGGYFDATVSGTNSRFGVVGAAGGTSGISYGVYGSANGTGTNWGGYFAGNVYTSGTYTPSDVNLKLNVKDYSNAMAMIAKIPVKSYTYKNDGIYGKMNLPTGNQVGIMAQDLEAAYPELVKAAYFEDTDSYRKGLVSKENMESIDFKAVNYTGLVPVMLKAMQEQQELIEKMQKEIEVLKKK